MRGDRVQNMLDDRAQSAIIVANCARMLMFVPAAWSAARWAPMRPA